MGNARIEGLADDLHITGNMYLFTLTIYFIGYVSHFSHITHQASNKLQVIFEVPCNIVLKRTTPRFWLPTLMLAWGIVSTFMGFCHNFTGFVFARLFLGITESGLFPGVVFYLSMWYKRTETHYRVALFFSAASLAGAFGGILAYGIAHMKGVGTLYGEPMGGWRWIFIIEGLITIVVAVGAYFFIYNYPATAEFLSDGERKFIVNRLKGTDANNEEVFTWANVNAALKDYKCWFYGFGFHTMSLPLYTLSLFLPSIIKELGYTAAQAQLLTVPPYAIATILTVVVAYFAEKTHKRGPFILGSSSIAIIGYLILLSTPKGRPGVSYTGTIFAAAGIYPSTAIVLSWPAANVSGQTKRATATAMTITIGNLGAVLGTQLYRPSTSPRWFLGHGFALGYLVLNLVNTSALWFFLNRENKRKVERREEAERLVGEVQDDSDLRWIFQT